MGKGYTVKKGLKHSNGKYVFFIDDDLPYFKELNYFIKKLINNNTKILIARRVNKLKADLLFNIRNYLSDLFSLFTKYLIGIKHPDTQAGLKGFNREVLKKIINYKTNGFVFDLEIIIIANSNGIKIDDVKVVSKVKDYNNRYAIELKFYLNIFKDIMIIIYNLIFKKY